MPAPKSLPPPAPAPALHPSRTRPHHGPTAPLLLALALGCGPRPEAEPARPAPAAAATAPDGSPPARPEWTTALGLSGDIQLRWRGASLMRVEYPFWGPRWRWANPEVEDPGDDGPLDSFRVTVPDLDVTVAAAAKAAAPGVLEVQLTTTVARDLGDVVGGGIELQLDSRALSSRPGYTPPERRPGGDGIRWRVGEGQAVTIRLDPAPVRLYFEQDDPERIRALLVGPGTPAGTYVTTMRIELPPGGEVLPSLSRRYAAGQTPWFAATMEWNRTPVDLRRLNDGHRPAGIHGRVEARGDRLVFADGTPARLWGTNVVAYSLFSADEGVVKAQARRLAALGFNLVRLHHHDSHWVDPNVFIKESNQTQTLSPDALARIDWWVKCLQDEGIYVWLDLHVGRRLRAGDRVPAFDEIAAREGELKGFNFVNPRVEALMHDFASRYLDRRNIHTGRRYADDPGIVGVLVTNENDVTHHFGNLMNADAGAPEHRRMMQAQIEPFARAQGLPLALAMQPWTYGPAKIAMNELEARFHLRFIRHLRAMGLRAPIATTSFWGSDPLASLPALTVGDLIDLHGYGGADQLEVDPRVDHNFIHRMAAGRVEGHPITITEWNLLPPVRDRFVGPMWMAGIASLQGWDAPMHYSYADAPLPPPDRVLPGMGLVDPATMALMPAAALAFREGHVRPAETRYRLVVDRAQLYEQPMGADRSAAIRTLSEQSRVELSLPDLPELAWDTPAAATPGAIEVRDLSKSFLPDDATAVVSDTGQLRRDWTLGVGVLDTPRTQAAYGWIGRRSVTTTDVTLDIDTPKATVVVSALDGRPIRESADLLISVAAQADSTEGHHPLRAQAVTGRLQLANTHEHLVMRPVTTGSRAAMALAGTEYVGMRDGDRHRLELPALPTHWFRVTPK